jgi:hypothetical protein
LLVDRPQDGIQSEPDEWLTLRVKRGGHTLDLSFLPRGGLVDAYQWERVPEVLESGYAF